MWRITKKIRTYASLTFEARFGKIEKFVTQCGPMPQKLIISIQEDVSPKNDIKHP